MIRHIVMFTLKDKSDAARVAADLRRLAKIPGALSVTVRSNLKVDQIGNDIDLVVYGEFEDVAALHAWKLHPTYAEVTAIVRPHRELRYAADIEF